MGSPEVLHDAFISYSRRDTAFAAALEKALRRYHPPGDLQVPQRHLSVFRDVNDFTGTEYHAAVEKHLRQSRKLIVLCSPAARASTFVNDEIELFAAAHGSSRIIPVLLAKGPDNQSTTTLDHEAVFPAALLAHARMPLAIDYHDFSPSKDRIDKGRFEALWFALLANLYDVSRSEIERREKKRQARVRRRWVAGSLGVIASQTALMIWALIERAEAVRRRDEAVQQRAEAIRQRDEAFRNQSVLLARESRQQTAAGRTDLGIRLALHALPRRLDQPDRPWVSAAETALVTAMTASEFRLALPAMIKAGEWGTLTEARISPDGRRAIVNWGEHAELWNLGSGELMTTYRPDQGYVTHTVFSPDARYVAVSYHTGTATYYGLRAAHARDDLSGLTLRGSVVELIESATGKRIWIHQWDGFRDNLIQFSPSGSILLVMTNDVVSLVEAATARPLETARWADLSADLAGPHAKATFSDDHKRVAFATNKGVIGILDRVTGMVRIQSDVKSATHSLRFLDALGNWLLAATNDAVVVTHWTSPGEQRLPMRKPAPVLAASYDGLHGAMVAITADAEVHTWSVGDIRNAKENVDATFTRPDVKLRRIELDEKCTAALVEHEDGTIEAWDLLARTSLTVHAGAADVRVIDMGFDERAALALLATSDGSVRVWERVTPLVAGRQIGEPTAKISAAAFRPHPDTSHVAIGDAQGALEIRDGVDNRVVWTALSPHKAAITHIAFDRTGGRVATASDDHTARVWTLPGGPPLLLKGHKKPVTFIGFSPAGDLVVTGSPDCTFRLWHAQNGALAHVLTIPREHLDSINNASVLAQALFTADGRRLVTVTAGDGYVIGQPALLWDVPTGKLLRAFGHPGAAIWHVGLTADDRQLVTAAYDNSAALWDLESGERLQTFAGHGAQVTRVIPYQDGRMIATASGRGAFRLWRSDSGQLVRDLRAAPGLFNALLARDGRIFITGSALFTNSEVALWDADEGVKLTTIHVAGNLSFPNGVLLSSDERLLLTRTKSEVATVWTMPPTGQRLIDLAWERVTAAGLPLLNKEQRIRFGLDTQ